MRSRSAARFSSRTAPVGRSAHLASLARTRFHCSWQWWISRRHRLVDTASPPCSAPPPLRQSLSPPFSIAWSISLGQILTVAPPPLANTPQLLLLQAAAPPLLKYPTHPLYNTPIRDPTVLAGVPRLRPVLASPPYLPPCRRPCVGAASTSTVLAVSLLTARPGSTVPADVPARSRRPASLPRLPSLSLAAPRFLARRPPRSTVLARRPSQSPRRRRRERRPLLVGSGGGTCKRSRRDRCGGRGGEIGGRRRCGGGGREQSVLSWLVRWEARRLVESDDDKAVVVGADEGRANGWASAVKC
ncbi:hypothetical protein Scep_015477 [Stephania cephalantha]|uniref:Uncharacterized protein n=1 Tax=Stephania cephalantha TaxID=152367 RepID=A0AAP0J5Q6_9MAGN